MHFVGTITDSFICFKILLINVREREHTHEQREGQRDRESQITHRAWIKLGSIRGPQDHDAGHSQML